MKSLIIGCRKVQLVNVAEFAFSDDVVVCAKTLEVRQHNIKLWSNVLKTRKFEINTNKTHFLKINKYDEKLNTKRLLMHQVSNINIGEQL